MKVLVDKALADGVTVKVVVDNGKIISTESADVKLYLDKLKAKIPGSVDDVVIDALEALLLAL